MPCLVIKTGWITHNLHDCPISIYQYKFWILIKVYGGLMKPAIKKNKTPKKLPVPCKITLFFVITGIIAGYVTGNLLKESLYSPLIAIYNETLVNIPELDIDKMDIFLLAIKRNLKLFVLLYLFALTNLWTYYYCAFSLYTGFTNGLLLAFNIILHGLPGIIRFLFYMCPQALIFIPLYLIVIAHCNGFHDEFISCTSYTFHDSTYTYSSKQKKGILAVKQLPFIVVCILFIIAGCFVEASLNLPVVIWYIGHIV